MPEEKSPSTKTSTPSALSLALSPRGRLYLAPTEGEEPLPPAVAARIEAAFSQGSRQGLLHLGASEVQTSLPGTLAYWRNFARRFMTRLCALPALEEARQHLQVPCPSEELSAWCQEAPPMQGGEHLTEEVLAGLWSALEEACRAELASFRGSVEEYLHQKSPLWNTVGRIYFHLAEKKGDETTPFAFLVTYTNRLSQEGKVQHLPLGQALRQYADAKDKEALLKLLLPLQKAAGKSAFLKELVDSGEIFHPQALRPQAAYRFLKDIPLYEECGVMVRIPDWWKARQKMRPEVQVTLGTKTPGSLSTQALLDFSLEVCLSGEPLSEEEYRKLLSSSSGLVLLRGKWVELDRQKFSEVLAHFEKVKKRAGREGISFLEGMRLLAGAEALGGSVEAPEVKEWSHVSAGGWLKEVLDGLSRPEALAASLPGPELRTTLRPYQKTGVQWLSLLSRLGLGACLADDMGLGKTLEVLGLLVLLRKEKRPPHLLVAPASLLANWQSEIGRFAPDLKVFLAHPSGTSGKELEKLPKKRLSGVELVITSYSMVYRYPFLSETEWDLVILDEAQAIKNPTTRQTRAVKALQSRGRLALTGTPLENRLSDLWSLFDFLNPGLLGSQKVFGSFAKRLEAAEKEGKGGYGPLRALCRPYILRRMKTDKAVIQDLPDKTEMKAFCPLSRAQAALYQESVQELVKALEEAEGMQRRGVILASLLRLKQICNHPSQWLGDDAYDPQQSGKFGRLAEICEVIKARQEKVLIFTQFRSLTSPLQAFLQKIFGRPGLVLHGQTPVKERQALVERFQNEEGIPFFLLSLKAGGTGLNLTAASHVIHFDRWWNPAVENQATDRAFRIGQKKKVLVHKFVCRGTVEEKIDAMIEAKQDLSRELLESGGEALLTEMSRDDLLNLFSLDLKSALWES